MFLFTDNFTFGPTYCKGYSTSQKILRIIPCLYQVIQDGALILHVIYVAGTHMKAWGVDGLSRGDLLDGMMAGENRLSFVLLVKGADERSDGKVGNLVKSW